jgi:hypothetical protein
VKLRNEDGVSITTKVATKQLCYIPITPRLKWLFLSKETAKQMRWHNKGKRESEDPDIMSHPADSEAWQALDHFDPEFVRYPRSVHLGLSTDGFQPHSTDSHPYSCWPVFVMPYNLPRDKCLKEGFIFHALVILGPKEPKKQMNIFLQPLFEELKKFWSGVDAYDSHLNCRFNLCAAYLWSIHDYLGYGKFAGWCVHGWLNCPICMDDSDAYRLEHGKKVTFFDCHRRFLPLSHFFRGDRKSFMKGKRVRKGPPKKKLGADITQMLDDLKESGNGKFEGYSENHNWMNKSCLWELPYAKALILPHNIDLMHQECNVAKSIISMCLYIISFSKDNMNARKDLAALYDHPLLEVKTNAKVNLTRP